MLDIFILLNILIILFAIWRNINVYIQYIAVDEYAVKFDKSFI